MHVSAATPCRAPNYSGNCWRAIRAGRRSKDASRPMATSTSKAATTAAFVVPDCPQCGGILKPDVVFFGEPVPRERVDRAFEGVAKADALLVVGSSLMVYSGFRFAEAAAAAGKPIAAVNLGQTRADHLLALKIASRAMKRLRGRASLHEVSRGMEFGSPCPNSDLTERQHQGNSESLPRIRGRVKSISTSGSSSVRSRHQYWDSASGMLQTDEQWLAIADEFYCAAVDHSRWYGALERLAAATGSRTAS